VQARDDLNISEPFLSAIRAMAFGNHIVQLRKLLVCSVDSFGQKKFGAVT
jgi:hypothetical protein